MRNQNGGNTLNEYFIKIEEKVKTLYEGKDDEQELKKLLSQIDLIKLDDDNDFHKTFENQMNFLIKSNEGGDFFDFKYQTGTNILEFIFNSFSKLKALNKNDIKKKDEEKENNQNDAKNKNNKIQQINDKSKESNDEKKIDMNIEDKNNKNNNISDSYHSDSNSSFSINKSNTIIINTSLDKNEGDKKLEDNNSKGDVENLNKQTNLTFNPEANISTILNEYKNKEKNKNMVFIGKNFNFKEYEKKIIGMEMEKEKKIKSISYYEDNSEINGNSFEYDCINYVFQKIYSVSTNKEFSIIYNLIPNVDKINKVFNGYGLYTLDKIQFDFIIVDLKISELIKFLKEILPGIHPNSKMNVIFGNKNFFSTEDLNNLEIEKENSDEKIDIFGEIGVNIFNEKE